VARAARSKAAPVQADAAFSYLEFQEAERRRCSVLRGAWHGIGKTL